MIADANVFYSAMKQFVRKFGSDFALIDFIIAPEPIGIVQDVFTGGLLCIKVEYDRAITKWNTKYGITFNRNIWDQQYRRGYEGSI